MTTSKCQERDTANCERGEEREREKERERKIQKIKEGYISF